VTVGGLREHLLLLLITLLVRHLLRVGGVTLLGELGQQRAKQRGCVKVFSPNTFPPRASAPNTVKIGQQ
jgi:hypothetical protein